MVEVRLCLLVLVLLFLLFLTFGVLAEGLTKFAYYFGCGCGFIVGGDQGGEK